MRAKTLNTVVKILLVVLVGRMWYLYIMVVQVHEQAGIIHGEASSSSSSVAVQTRLLPPPAENSAARTRTSNASPRKPRFWLHIGPHKSATTSIQCSLHANAELLREDSTIFLGKIDGGFCGQKTTKYDRIRKIDECILQQDETGEGACWKNLVAEWDEFRRQGMDLIISKESFSDWASYYSNSTAGLPIPTIPTTLYDENIRKKIWTKLATALEPWNVTILMTYRHFYQWLPSAYVQHAYHMIQSNQPWPEEKLPPTFPQFLESVLDGQAHPPYPFVDTILKSKDRYFPPTWNIQLLNLHKKQKQKQSNDNDHKKNIDDIASFLICDVLQAPHTCQNFIAVGTKRTSPAEALVFDRLNMLAKINGWMMTEGRNNKRFARMKQTRKRVVDATAAAAALQDDSSASFNPKSHFLLATVCPSNALLERFLEASLSLQRQLVGGFDDGVGVGDDDSLLTTKQHVEGFWNATQTFCSVDVSRVFSENPDAWRKILSH